MHREKIAIIGSYPHYLIRFRLELMRDIVAKGYKVYGMSPNLNSNQKKILKDSGIEPIEISLNQTRLNPVYDIIDVIKLRKKLKKLKIDTVLSYTIKPVIYGTMAARLANVQNRFSLVEGLGYSFTESNERSKKKILLKNIVKSLYKSTLFMNDKVFMLNEDDVNLFNQERLVSLDKMHRLNGIGVDLEKYEYSKPITDRINFLFVGRLLKEKGVVEFIEAADIIKREYKDVNFIIVGGVDPNPGSITEEYIQKYVRKGVIEWPNEVEDVIPWYKKSSVFVLPSYYREGIPRTTQEAMSIGRPIITSDGPGCRETVEDGVNGKLIKAQDISSLINAIKVFINEPKLIESMGAASRSIAEKKYDINKINEEILNVMGLNNKIDN